MTTLPRRCLGCGTKIPAGSRCDPCQAQVNWQHDQRRGKTAARGYDAAWARLSKAAIKAQPYCSDCGHWGSNDNPLTGDHLRWPAVTLDDVDVVCRRCNSRRGARRRLTSSDPTTTRDPSRAGVSVTHPAGVPGLA
jgi:5-methylcytosine-specific restriction enzyme A